MTPEMKKVINNMAKEFAKQMIDLNYRGNEFNKESMKQCIEELAKSIETNIEIETKKEDKSNIIY